VQHSPYLGRVRTRTRRSRAQKSHHTPQETSFTGYLALPNCKYLPTSPSKQRSNLGVPCTISRYLLNPVLGIRFRNSRTAGTAMPVPKAPVDENYFTTPVEYDVRAAGQFTSVQPVAITRGMQEPPHRHLWGRVSTPHGPHGSPSQFRRFHISDPANRR